MINHRFTNPPFWWPQVYCSFLPAHPGTILDSMAWFYPSWARTDVSTSLGLACIVGKL